MTTISANFEEEVASYDRLAKVSTWAGPRYRLTYRVLGEGPPIVVVPGIASTYRGYALLLNRLSSHFQTILYDYPGENPGDGADLSQISHDDLVSDLIGLADHLGLDRLVPIGVSFGSTVTLSALHRRPDLFPKGVLQGGFAYRKFPGIERLALRVGRLFPGSLGNLPLRGPILTIHGRSEFRDEVADRWPLYLAENGRTPIASMAHRLTLLSRLDLRPILPEIDADVLLIQGDHDRIVPRRDFETLRANLSRSRPILLPGVGHQPHYTDAERFAEEVAGFLVD